ncbi:TonB-dependent receptor [Pedobacter sp. MC2016-05]|uniref:SusC/RagA family TonB-linked outer membrane protein n=1 Tax=Pedobacter sp. MC2016-05 TaxID=2994474 RepID=UPI002247412C|nr:TonB-dependent receptor [Pedobacter sp. MC2016-05]MCX2473413.1 TonB-dependent receptor [Pedobacter sp. MC2016-05]
MSKNLHNNPLFKTLGILGVIGGMVTLPILSFAVAPPKPLVSISKSKLTKVVPVRGTVVDAKGGPLPGVVVKVKGGGAAVATDADGRFTLNLETGNETLVLSLVGFKSTEFPVNGKTEVKIVMSEDIANLEDVVVVGYGTVKKKDLTGAVSSIKSEDITISPVSNAVEAMQGRIAGLDIQRTSGSAGSTPTILLRGNRSIAQVAGALPGASSDPLYVIDGIIGNINSLNPNDIETIDVLKDASSTAIYGVAGANGVIIITTKKAKAGKVQVDIDSYYGVNGFAKYPEPLTGDAYVQYVRDRYFAGNGRFPNNLADAGIPAAGITAINEGQWVNWVDETLQTGSQQNHHISVRGGSEKTQAYLSLGYIGEKGIYKGDQSTILNARSGVDVAFSKFFKAGVQVTANLRNGDQTNSRINKAFGIYPLGTAYTADGSVNLFPLTNVSLVSPIANYAPGVFANNNKNLFLQLNPYVEFKPTENLTIRSNLGVTLSSDRRGTFANENSYNLASENRNVKEASYATNLNYGYLWENIVTYNYAINKDHQFTFTGITSMADNRTETSTLSGNGLDFDEYLYYNLGAATTITGRGTGYLQSNRLSFAGRINYNFKGKYLLQLSNRWDGVSQLIDKWSSFPSASVAWRISDEKFMESTKDWLSNLKLRAGYGVAGNPSIQPYQNSTLVAARTNDYNLSLGGSSALPIYVLNRALGSPNLTWERSYNFNLGLDFTLFNGRLDVSSEWFKTKSKGVLFAQNMPPTAGGYDAKTQYYVFANIGETKNDGVELTINSRNIDTKNFKWNSTLTFTRATEELTKIDLGTSGSVSNLITNRLFVGDALPQSILYGYKKIGIWQLGEETEAAKYGARPGDIKLQTVPRLDANGVSDNGVHPYSANDRMIVGRNIPDFNIGFQNTFAYKGFDLTVFMVMRYGQMIDAQLLGYYNSITQPAFYNYWTPTNPTNDYPQPTIGGTTNNINTLYQSALSYVDGSYFKVKNITLGYALPDKFIKKVGLSRLRVYGTAYNTLIFAKSALLKNIDPETGGNDSFPLYKQIVFGLNASF